jgi:Ankyrin repeats (3 copies)
MPLEVAVNHGSCGVISILIKNPLTAITEKVVKSAAGKGKNGKEVLTVLLKQRGVDVTITGDVVKAAAGNRRNWKEIMMLLLQQRGADVTITEEVVKAAAGNWGNGKEVMMLLLEQRGAEVAITEYVVKEAAGNEESGNEVMMLLLAHRGPEIVITDEVVQTAVTCGQEEVLRIFEKQFKLSPSRENRLIAQFYNASKAGEEATIQKLLAEGVEPDLKNIRHVSPLWIAATRGYLNVVQALLDTKAVDVNSRSISGRPPIFWAAAYGEEEIVRVLLKAGADPCLVDIDGNTPLWMAKQNGHNKIAQMLAGY